MHCEQAGAAQSVVSLVVEGGVSSGGRQNGNRTHITAMITAAESSAHLEQGCPCALRILVHRHGSSVMSRGNASP